VNQKQICWSGYPQQTSCCGLLARSLHWECSAKRQETEVTTSVLDSTSPTKLRTVSSITFCVMRLSTDPLLYPVMARCKTVPAHSLYSVNSLQRINKSPSMPLFPSSKYEKQGPSHFFWKVSKLKCISYLKNVVKNIDDTVG
jgi:hypothetical protein